jgi:hypothetical protein
VPTTRTPERPRAPQRPWARGAAHRAARSPQSLLVVRGILPIGKKPDTAGRIV